MPSLNNFKDYISKLEAPRVLELGTKRSIPDRCTMKKDEWITNYSEYHGTDIEADIDVDIIADVHRLSSVIKPESYDIVISCSSFEHFKYPHLAAFEISKILKMNGALFIQTHCCFPLHAYPYDYFRFSTEAISGCFGTKNGIDVVSTDYKFPCGMSAQGNPNYGGSFLNVNLFGIKKEKTPKQYQYEFDAL
jgi:hypothetical protein